MYIAMNRFKIILGRETEFEKIWKERDTHLDDVPGFKKFNLIKGKNKITTDFMRPTANGIQNKIL